MYYLNELWHSKSKSWLVKSSISDVDTDTGVVVSSLCSLVSMGTERLVTTEELNDEISKNMKVPYMKGNFQSEFTYGYSIVGKVIDGPQELKNKLVHVMHPHQDVLNVSKNDLFVLPDGIDPKLASLASNMETALNAIWDANVEIGDKVLVIGYGTIGGLVALLAKNIVGVEVFVLDQDDKRNDLALKQGVNPCIEGVDFDVVFNTSASSEMLQKAIEVTRVEGKIVELSWYGFRDVTLKLGADFHYGRKQIICSQVSQIPNRKKPVWDYLSRKELVFRLLDELKPSYLIDYEVPYSESPLFFEKLRKEKIDAIGVVINYNI